MSNRAVVPLFAVLISSLAGAALTVSAVAAPTTEDKAETSANDCLAAPKGETPKGAHWYYRLEKGTKRKCWYLGDQVAKTSKVASATPTPAPSVKPAQPRAPEAAIQPAVANARAELTARSPKAENAPEDATLSETIWPAPETTDAAASQNDQGTNVQSATTGAGPVTTPPAKDWAMTSRWPDSNLANAANNQSAAPVDARPQQPSPLQPVSTKDKSATPVATGQFHGISLDSTAMLLIMLAGVLTLVAVGGRMIIKYSGYGQAKNRNSRRNIWDSVPRDNDPSNAYEALLQPRNSQFAREPAEANDPSDEIEKLLRASKRAAA